MVTAKTALNRSPRRELANKGFIEATMVTASGSAAAGSIWLKMVDVSANGQSNAVVKLMLIAIEKVIAFAAMVGSIEAAAVFAIGNRQF